MQDKLLRLLSQSVTPMGASRAPKHGFEALKAYPGASPDSPKRTGF